MEQLLGKGAVEKKKPKALGGIGNTAAPKKLSSRSNSTTEEKKLGPIVTPLPAATAIEKKPLPNISAKVYAVLSLSYLSNAHIEISSRTCSDSIQISV